MYSGVLTTKNKVIRIDRDISFVDILKEMEALKKEHSGNDLMSIDIFEDNKAVASLRLI